MVHTIELFLNLNLDEINYIINRFNITSQSYYNFNKHHNVDGVNIEIKKLETKIGKRWRLNIFIDIIKLLGRAEINQEDKCEIIDRINEILYELFSYIPELSLYRIDYRFDVVIDNIEKRKLLIKLYNKCENKKAYMKKQKVYNKRTGRSHKYSSLRYKNKSKSCNIYDKEIERAAKCESVKEYEKDVLRFEAQVKRKHIQYMKKQYNIEDSLEIYFTAELYNVFMTKIVISTIGLSDYFNGYHARNIIRSSTLKEKEKNELIKFLEDINGNNTLQKGKEIYSSYKHSKFIKQLKYLNINPILIPKNSGFSKIKNPIKDILL